jgi:lysozyme
MAGEGRKLHWRKLHWRKLHWIKPHWKKPHWIKPHPLIKSRRLKTMNDEKSMSNILEKPVNLFLTGIDLVQDAIAIWNALKSNYFAAQGLRNGANLVPLEQLVSAFAPCPATVDPYLGHLTFGGVICRPSFETKTLDQTDLDYYAANRLPDSNIAWQIADYDGDGMLDAKLYTPAGTQIIYYLHRSDSNMAIKQDTIIKAKHQLTEHEGLRLKPYKCSAGKLTIGIGRNLDDKGISKNEANHLFENDLDDVMQDLFLVFPDFESHPENVQIAMMDMRFNLGGGGFRQFKKMIAAVQRKDYRLAADEMQDSRWFSQVGRRGKKLVKMMQA